jgi:hypothetical protein
MMLILSPDTKVQKHTYYRYKIYIGSYHIPSDAEATELTSDASTALLSAQAEIADYFREYRNKNHGYIRLSTFRGWKKETTIGERFLSKNIRREVDEICALLGYYAACSGNCLQTFREKLTVPSSRVNGPIG